MSNSKDIIAGPEYTRLQKIIGGGGFYAPIITM